MCVFVYVCVCLYNVHECVSDDNCVKFFFHLYMVSGDSNSGLKASITITFCRFPVLIFLTSSSLSVQVIFLYTTSKVSD